MAQIFFNSFGQSVTLALWSFVVLLLFIMGSSVLLSSSRQTFAFAHDGALPFSGWLYSINAYTKSPVNTVWFVAVCSLALGLLSFPGAQAINTVFSITVCSLYTASAIPISARWLCNNDFKSGPFSLGIFSLPISVVAVFFMSFMVIVFCFPTIPEMTVANMNYTVVVLAGVTSIILSLVWYIFPKYGGLHWFHGPVRNVPAWEESGDEDRRSTEKNVK